MEYSNWFDLLFVRDDNTKLRTDTVISVDKAKLRLAGLQRYLESYRYNTGLNFLSGVLRLYSSSYKGTEGEWRLEEAFQSIKDTMNFIDQRKIITETLKLATHFEINEKDSIAEMIIKHFREYAKEVFNTLKDRYSLSVLLEEPASRLNKIMEDM